MAKRKKSLDAVKKPDTKTLNHVKAPKSRGSKNKNKLEVGKAAGAISAVQTSKKSKEEKVQSSTRQHRSTGKTSARQTSKYFQDQPVVKNEPASEEDGIINPVLGTEAAVLKVEKREKEESEDEDDDDEVEWEDVEDLGETSCALPSQPVEIEIEAPDQALKRKKRDKRKAEFENYLRRMMKRFNKELVVDMHKVHLLCLVASGIFRNKLCTEPDLLAVALSVLPAHLTRVPPEEVDTGFLCSLLKWFGATFTLNPDLPQEQGDSLQAVLERRFGTYSARNHQEITYLFLIVLRSLQLFCRLVLSLQPLPLKQPPVKGKGKPACDTPQKSPTEPKVSPGAKRPAEPRAGGAGRGGKRQRNKEPELETSASQQPKNSQRRRVASKVCYREESSDGEGNSEGEEFHVSSDEDSEDMDGCATRQLAKKQSGKGRVSRSRGGRKQGDCEREVKGWRRQGEGVDEWLEVYLEKAGRWVCLDVHQASVGQPLLCSKQATQPLCYVLAVDGDGCLKDLGCRYDPTWLTSTRKRRVEEEWWEETLCAFRNPNSERELQEDQELQAKLLDKPLPTAISEYKNHPLYALKRHLLKYEALYPPTATVLGYCRGEAVYSRDCIHTLHSRDTWLKEARTVRLGEEPYKMVKGFSNRSRKARLASENRDIDDLPLFGQWQTEEYQPPVAVDGKVPRNDYGNVYLFRPCMLPIGCVHLRLPNLHRVARKLDIDCASAVTGFDFHCGFSHPVNDGYIVCEEHQEVLRAAWENEQELLEQKEKEKREKRVVANWTLLVKGLLIRERLRRRYGTKELEPAVGEEGLSSGEEDDKGACTAAVTLASSWPQNRQEDQVGDTTKREKRGRQKNLFPFEKV